MALASRTRPASPRRTPGYAMRQIEQARLPGLVVGTGTIGHVLPCRRAWLSDASAMAPEHALLAAASPAVHVITSRSICFPSRRRFRIKPVRPSSRSLGGPYSSRICMWRANIVCLRFAAHHCSPPPITARHTTHHHGNHGQEHAAGHVVSCAQELQLHR